MCLVKLLQQGVSLAFVNKFLCFTFFKGRVLLAEGVLTKSCRTGVKPRQFFLFNDILVYGSILVRDLRFSRQHILPLHEVSVRLLAEGEGEVDHGMVINTRTKSFTVYAATRGEKMGWMETINKVTQAISRHDSELLLTQSTARLLERSGKAACREFAPVMLPNKTVTACMSCHMEFG